MRRALSLGLPLFAGAFLFVLPMAAASAQASDPPNATGPCEAVATLSNGVVVDPYASSGVYEMPISGSASYSGGLTTEVDTPRPISGEVRIETPPGIPDITISDEWVWDDADADGVGEAGEVSWKLPSSLPRGVEMTVSGIHSEPGIVCEGSVVVKLEGGFFDSPVAYGALAGTVITAAGVVAAMFSAKPSAPVPPPPPSPTPGAF